MQINIIYKKISLVLIFKKNDQFQMTSRNMHLRHCLLFAFQLKKTAYEATEMIISALGEGAVTYKTSKKWFSKFREGNFDLSDSERPGQSKRFLDEDLEILLDENSCQTQQDLAKQLGVSQQAISLRLGHLGIIQKACRWVPHILTPENKKRRYDTAVSLLTRFKKKSFLHKIITGDEKWVYYENPKRKKSWVRPGEPSNIIAKRNIHAAKTLLCIWWDCEGVVYHEFLKPGETVTGERYKSQLIRLNEALAQKRPFTGAGTRPVILLHDNARPHTSKTTVDYLSNLGWEVLPHAAYSPDMAPSDYYLFRSLQHHLADEQFKTLDDVQKSLTNFIHSKSPSFFRTGIHELPEKWLKCINNDGDYFPD